LTSYITLEQNSSNRQNFCEFYFDVSCVITSCCWMWTWWTFLSYHFMSLIQLLTSHF